MIDRLICWYTTGIITCRVYVTLNNVLVQALGVYTVNHDCRLAKLTASERVAAMQRLQQIMQSINEEWKQWQENDGGDRM